MKLVPIENILENLPRPRYADSSNVFFSAMI